MNQKSTLPALPSSRRLRDSLLRIGDIAAQLPGAQSVQELLGATEQRVLSELKGRLDKLPNPQALAGAGSAAADGEHPGQILARLLNQNTEQNRDAAIAALYRALVKELLPDEASLLAALADNTRYALLHVVIGGTLAARQPIAENFCGIAQASSVKLRDEVPGYIAHLRSLGLVQEGPEDKSLEIKYQILEGSLAVQQCVADLKKQGKTARMLRRSLKISALGAALWAYCEPEKYLDN